MCLSPDRAVAGLPYGAEQAAGLAAGEAEVAGLAAAAGLDAATGLAAAAAAGLAGAAGAAGFAGSVGLAGAAVGAAGEAGAQAVARKPTAATRRNCRRFIMNIPSGKLCAETVRRPVRMR